MKKLDLTKLREKTAVELEKLVAEKKNDSKADKNSRRDVAQILTVIGEKKLNENAKR